MLVHVGKHIYQMPDFIHDFGDRYHHMSMMRTAKIDEEYGGYLPNEGPANWRLVIHVTLDDLIFYPIRDWLKKHVGDNEVSSVLRSVLGFFWGFNCNFPPRDVVLHTAWELHGCKPIRVWDEKRKIIYPSASS